MVTSTDHPAPVKRNLRREITVILVIKVAIILVAGFTIFGKSHRVHVSTQSMTDKLLPISTPLSTEPTR